MLYGESGSGKSSLVNAGLIPAAEAEGYRTDRLRVQPRRGEELVVERMPLSEGSDAFLPSTFAEDGDGPSQIVLSVEGFGKRLEGLPSDEPPPLLVFDQFEELVTLFEEAPVGGDDLEEVRQAQQRIVEVLGRVLRDERLRVKLLLGFREDYLAKVKKLLHLHPELVSQSMRLSPPGTNVLPRIIRGPFEDYPRHFGRELSSELAERLAHALERRSTSGTISLSEVQIVCLRLWESPDPDGLLEKRHVRGVLEDYLEESLERFPEELRYPAVALLSQMVTASGARDVVSADDLIERVREDEPEISEERLERALDTLEKETKLVRREQRHDLDLYEITSEFLVPWIGRQREKRLRAREQRRLVEHARQQRARLMFAFGILGSVLFLLGAAFGALALYQSGQARSERDESLSLLLSGDAVDFLKTTPRVSLEKAYRAYRIKKTPAAEEALRSALVALHRRAVLRHDRNVRSAAFDADGSRVVTASEDGVIRLWEPTTGDLMESFGDLRSDAPGLNWAAFSPDGRRIVTAGEDGVTQVWDSATRRPTVALGKRRDVSPDLSAVFSPDGKRILTASRDAARVWSAATGKLLRRLVAHDGELLSAAFGPDGALIVTAGADGDALVWDANTGTVVTSLRGDVPLLAARFSPDGTRVVTAGQDPTAHVWDVESGRLVSALRQGSAALTSAVFSRDGRLIATTGTDNMARIWDVETERVVSVLRGHEDSVLGADFSADGTRIVTAGGGEDATARVWDAVDAGKGLLEGVRPLATAAFDRNAAFVVIVRNDRTAEVRPRSSLRSPGAPLGGGVTSVSFSPDGTLIAIAGRNGARIVDVRGRPSSTFPRLGALKSASFDPTGARLVTAGARAAVLDLNTGARTDLVRPDPVDSSAQFVSAAFSSDGEEIVTVAVDGVVTLWNRHGRWLGDLPLPPVKTLPSSAAFGPGDRLVVVGGRTARIWNVTNAESPQLVAALAGHRDEINTAVFSRDGRFVVTASNDRTARIWESGSGRLVAVLPGHPAAVLAAGFDRGAQRVWTASADGALRAFTCESCVPVDQLLRLGNWTDAELAGEAESSR